MEKSDQTKLLVPNLVDNGGKENNFTSTGGTRNGNFHDFKSCSLLEFPGGGRGKSDVKLVYGLETSQMILLRDKDIRKLADNIVITLTMIYIWIIVSILSVNYQPSDCEPGYQKRNISIYQPL